MGAHYFKIRDLNFNGNLFVEHEQLSSDRLNQKDFIFDLYYTQIEYAKLQS